MKGSIPLRDIVLVDFSPKTPSPKGTDAKLLEEQTKVGMSAENEIVLKITLVNGRRFTFACEQDKAVTWAADLSRHAAAARFVCVCVCDFLFCTVRRFLRLWCG